MENEQLDHSLLKSHLSDDTFIGLVKKYGALLLIVNILQAICRLSLDLLPLSSFLSEYSSVVFTTYFQMFFLLVGIIGNLVVAVVIFQDMRKNGNVSWVVLGVTLTFKEVGAIFFLLMYLYQYFRRPA